MSERDKPIEVSATVLGEINQTIGRVEGLAEKTWERVDEMSTRQAAMATSLSLLETKFVRVEREHYERFHLGGCEDSEDGRQSRSASDIYRAVGAKVDEHVGQVEDSLTEKINLAALQAARDAIKSEMRDRAEEVKRQTDIDAAKCKVEAEKKVADAEAEISRIKVRAARFRSWGVAVVGVLLAVGGGVGWKSCMALESVQARTEATLKRIETKAAQARKPDAAIEP